MATGTITLIELPVATGASKNDIFLLRQSGYSKQMGASGVVLTNNSQIQNITGQKTFLNIPIASGVSFQNGGNFIVGVDNNDNFFKISRSALDITSNAAITINSSNNVGIGIESPAHEFHIEKDSSQQDVRMFIKTNSAGTTAASIIQIANNLNKNLYMATFGSGNTEATIFGAARTNRSFIFADQEVLGVGTLGAYEVVIGTNNTQAITINSSQQVGIGKSPAYQLELSTDSAGKPSTNTWTIVSDERVKTDIRPFTDGLDVIKNLNPILYKYNGKLKMQDIINDKIGFIAQDAKEIVPYMFPTFEAKLNEDDEENTELYNYEGHALQFILINAIKEILLRLEILESK